MLCTNYPPDLTIIKREYLDLLWVGKFDFRKQLRLALQTIAAMNGNVRLHVVGEENEAIVKPYRELANQLGITDNVEWHGKMSHDNVLKMMRQSDVFLFTSINEGTPHVVLEAIQENLPVVCFNTCGQGAAIDETVGRKIELTTPKDSAKRFALILDEMKDNRDMLFRLKSHCHTRSIQLAWEGKAKQMMEIYENITK